ncbi:peptidase S8/S53 domain-containing protein [Roridomyces roridus]|uniref:Peptidase S8/S53 domain-containing protein n=1 Tax=Roridomyces roridus TaxID=1738132 RepID=A0AAD7AWR8_9AGAR|nr:peptidase S8/S53 domain-containing protein [Roridomyces roridus]
MKAALLLALFASSTFATTNLYIVEVADASDIPAKRHGSQPHERLYRSLQERKISFDVQKEYNSPGIFLGASISLNDVANVLSADGVVAIRPVHTYSSPKPVSFKVVSPGDPALPDSESTHILTGVDKLHEQAIIGKGVKIGIIDTGIDYTHPSLGGGFGPGFKVAGGYDFVGDNYNGHGRSYHGRFDHNSSSRSGTLVGGIIGANPGNPFNISGVAYGAELWAYRVVSCFGSVTDDIVIDALLMSVKDGMNVLSLSLGQSSGWTEGTTAVVASRIAATGKIVAIAAGNDASSTGSWFTSTPGNAINAISVASSDNTVVPQTDGTPDIPAPSGGLVSSFSSYGPTYDMYFKPSITAPGGNILTTLPVPLGSWGVASGVREQILRTSMSAPFMAGSAALLFQVKGKSASTAAQQGAGLVQPYAAIFTSTVITPAELLLNDTTHFAGPQKITIKNVGKTVQSYTLSHVPAGTAVTLSPGTIDPTMSRVPLAATYATVTFNMAEFTLGPGQAQQVVATISPPQGLDPSTLPVYSGFIYATSGNDSVHATYLGVAAPLRNAQVLDDTDSIFGFNLPVILDPNGNPQNTPTNYTFVGGNAPTVLWRQVFGTPLLRLDLVAANIVLNATISARAVPLLSFSNSHNGGTFAQVPTIGPLLEMDFLGRNDQFATRDRTFLLSNIFANGTVIPDGSYKILLRALKVTGDPKNEADYESWLSPIVGIAA